MKSVIYIFPILLVQIGFCQQVSIKIKADRQYSKEAEKIGFNVQIKNNSFNEFYIQDTLYIQRHAGLPAGNYIWPYMEKKEKGKYVPGEFGELGGNLVPDSCITNCCNCLLLKKGDVVQFNANLLKPFKLEKGEYRVYVTFHPPITPNANPKIYKEFISNYVYFSIN